MIVARKYIRSLKMSIADIKTPSTETECKLRLEMSNASSLTTYYIHMRTIEVDPLYNEIAAARNNDSIDPKTFKKLCMNYAKVRDNYHKKIQYHMNKKEELLNSLLKLQAAAPPAAPPAPEADPEAALPLQETSLPDDVEPVSS